MTRGIVTLLLHLDHRPTDQERELLVRAKTKAGLDVDLLPHRAFVGCNGRVLAIGEAPNWVADYALATGFDDPNLHRMLKWVILGDEVLGEIPGPTRKLDVLQSILGPGVKEITETVDNFDW